MGSQRCGESVGRLEKVQFEQVGQRLFIVDTIGNQTINFTDYNKNAFSFLGGDIVIEEPQTQVPRCFNCGDKRHMVSSCPLPYDRSLIALSRAMHTFFRDTMVRKQERLHEYAERISRSKYYNCIFEPGTIGPEVLSALELRQDDISISLLPWYPRMLEWGYPPGWESVENPRELVNARIGGEGSIENVDSLRIFRSVSPSSEESSNDGHIPQSTRHTPDRETSTLRRWAHYSTHLFSSEHLPVYSGRPLPADTDNIYSRKIPPWSYPGAFSAFGPVGWQELINLHDSENNEGECEMDLSE